ncbi:MAG: AAA family ATPase [Lacunisphaera sp.]
MKSVRPSSARTRSSSACSSRFSPTVTCSSRACPVSPRHSSSDPSAPPSASSSSASSSRPTSCRATSWARWFSSPKDGGFTTHKGPIFANLVLADEINRAPAKVQSAPPRGHAGTPGHHRRHLAHPAQAVFS